ncbi:hypothetical protein WMY93_001322 [Mugilogobius chulae]|uniref:Gypsy retrotransposon integrase-like protein 1 n=1 Tax=Mugilogobius chulae TaxID=88201 RepID=A0AAW0Q1Y5_9GOBI
MRSLAVSDRCGDEAGSIDKALTLTVNLLFKPSPMVMNFGFLHRVAGRSGGTCSVAGGRGTKETNDSHSRETRESRRQKRDGRKTGATRSTGQTRKSQPPNHGTAQDTRPDLHEPSENTTKRHTRWGRGNSASEEPSHTWSGQKTEHREVKSGQRQGVKALPRRDRRRGNQRTGGRGGSQELSTVTLYNSRGRGNPALSVVDVTDLIPALRDQLLLGLRDGPLAQALKVYARRNPDQDFAALRQEALLLDSEYGPSTSEVTCFAVNKQYASPRTPQEEHWKEQLKREIMEDVKAQMKGLTQEIVAELRPMLQPPPVHSATPTPPPTYPRRNAPYSDRDERVFKCPQTSNLSQHFKQQKAWRDAFATCSKIEVVPAEDGLLGHVRLASKKNVTVPPKSEQMVWGRAKVGTRGANYCALVEPLPGAGGVAVAKSLVMVKGGRLPVRVCNPHPYSVSIGRFEKIGQLCCVDAADVHGADDVSLSLVEDDIVEVALVKAADTQVSPEVRDLSNRSDLSEQQQEQLRALLVKWEKVFAQHDEDFGRTNLVQHRIPTGDAAPVRERYRPIPPLLYKEVKSLLSGMLEQGVIKESCSPWAAPIVLVRKKDGSWRFCVDYRKLNAVTHKDAFPLPRIEETLTSLSKSEWFSTLDLASGYWQVEMHPDDREKTAFTTPLGLFEFERMPFGLCDAPATFQRLMQQCLNGQIAESLLVYLDDIIIYSADFSSHLQHLDQVFERLWQHGLKLKPDKCKLLQREVTFLGHVVDRNGVRPDPGKIKAVQDWSAPTTVKEPFIVYTDASNQGLGAVLSQVQDGHERVIAYASRSLHPTEQNDANYSSFKLELLALKWAVTEKFKDYLTGAQFTIYTDNNPLAHLQTANLGAVEQRWVAQLASFDYTVKYRSGKTNVNADVLSRFPVPTERDRMPEDPGPMVAAVEMTPNGEEWKEAQALDPDIQTVRRYVEWKRFPKRAERLSLSQTAQKLLQHWRRLEVRNDVLYRVVADKDTLEERPQIVCPNTRREEVWRSVHEAGAHFGPEKTLSRLRQQFYWPGMEGEVRTFHQRCLACSLQKSRVEPKAPLHPFTATFPLEVIGLDFLSLGRPSDPWQNILVATDLFTRFAWAIPTRDQTAQTTVKMLWKFIIQQFGCPARFHSDRGPNFESALMQQLCEMYGIAKSRTTSYHPAGNGSVERFNQTLLNMLRSLEEEKQNRWPEYLPELVHAYNNTEHSATGYAPSFLMFGRHLRLPVDVGLGVNPRQAQFDVPGWVKDHQNRLAFAYSLAQQKAANAASQHKRQFDKRAHALPLVPGERVWVRNRHRQGKGKLSTWWDPEPHVILDTVGETGVVYKVRPEKGGREQTIHRNSLKVCTVPPVDPLPPRAPAPETPHCELPLFYGFLPEPQRGGRKGNKRDKRFTQQRDEREPETQARREKDWGYTEHGTNEEEPATKPRHSAGHETGPPRAIREHHEATYTLGQRKLCLRRAEPHLERTEDRAP